MLAHVRLPSPLDAATLTAVLRGLTAYNAAWLRAHPSAPPLYRSGVRYQRERSGAERWQVLPELLAARRGDCEDLATARAAELQVAGDAGAHAVAKKIRPGLWHIVVRHGDGRIEDPSKRLGMHKKDTMAGTDYRGGWRLRREGSRWRFELDLPLGMKATGTGKSKPEAMRAAAALAQQAAQNPALQALLPPQAQAAIKAASIIAKSPAAREAWGALKKGGSLVKAASRLKFW